MSTGDETSVKDPDTPLTRELTLVLLDLPTHYDLRLSSGNGRSTSTSSVKGTTKKSTHLTYCLPDRSESDLVNSSALLSSIPFIKIVATYVYTRPLWGLDSFSVTRSSGSHHTVNKNNCRSFPVRNQWTCVD